MLGGEAALHPHHGKITRTSANEISERNIAFDRTTYLRGSRAKGAGVSQAVHKYLQNR